MKHRLLMRAAFALTLVACGIDVMGVAPLDGGAMPMPTGDGSSPDAMPGVDGNEPGDGASADGMTLTDARVDSSPVDASKPDTNVPVDASLCAECAPGTPRTQCASTGCLVGYRVFVTSKNWQGNLGGLSGGDAKCQQIADEKAFGGTWRAWLSSASSSPTTRFTKSPSLRYRLLDGTVIADDWTDLTNGNLGHNLDLDENGSRVTAADGSEAWTGTTTAGSATSDTCSGFVNSGGGANTAFVGVTHLSDSRWTMIHEKTCDSNLRLYCFEQ